ncbi:unnamed protein product [Caenorhabditis angaria]|uniref:Uncharacterized protein n=1 Tax=Caenorhabditis angaria TaxID=860376 RepID=A0A9P1I8F2_9PELO|nr:unnamed protein product [Caenorhabditis angaria]
MKPIIVKNDIKLKYVFHGVEHLGGSEPLDSDVYDIEGLKWEFYIWGDWGPIDHVSLDYSQKNKNWADGRWFAETKGTYENFEEK